MKITSVKFDIWILRDSKCKNIEDEKEAEELLAEVCRLITSKGYYLPSKMVDENPHLYISKG